MTPDAGFVTVHIHHSFIRLPDDGYEPIAYDPRSGIIGLAYDAAGFADYATAIGDDLTVDFGRRHRLKKKDPSAAVSEAVEPIVYYLDRGAPEPVRSALLEGARWWNQAFEAAGYKDAFQVELLPDGVDPDGCPLQRHSVGASLDTGLVLRRRRYSTRAPAKY